VEFTTKVRLKVLEIARETTRVPDATEVALALGSSTDDVVVSFHHLGESHVYVLEPTDPARLRMANPFSAVPTPFLVHAGGRSYFGNCVWDALGVVSLLGGTGRLETRCPDCQAPLSMEIQDRRVVRADGVVHFGTARRHWWDDIIHT